MKNTILTILGFGLVILFYLLYISDRLLTAMSLQPKVGFTRFLHNPTMKVINPKWLGGEEIEHNLHTMALIRLVIILFLYILWSWIW